MSAKPRQDKDDRDVTVTVNLRELYAAHTATFPQGHDGAAYCKCSIAHALREVRGFPHPGTPEFNEYYSLTPEGARPTGDLDESGRSASPDGGTQNQEPT